MPEFRVPPLIVTGAGSAPTIGSVLRDRGYGKALVIADPTVGALASTAAVLAGLRGHGVEVALHDGVTGEPTLRMVEAALEAHRAAQPDVVVGLGGGSVMDAAKAVAVLATNEGPLPRYEGADKVPHGRAPLVCIA